MCILFMLIDNDCKGDGFEVIIANNRDEYYDRPTQPANFWPTAPHCIGGVDLQPGRQGGTWFGLSKHGKFATLLAILDKNEDKKGRGYLVTNYLTSEVSARDYLDHLSSVRAEYNRFNLVIMERKLGKWFAHYLSNLEPTSPFPLPDGIVTLGNQVYDNPWQKVIYGRDIFTDIVSRWNSMATKDTLKTKLLELLNDASTHLPDPVLEKQGSHLSKELVEQRSGIFVDSRQVRYGTRTNTIILCDKNGGVEYTERTLECPGTSTAELNWTINSHNFKFETN